MVNDVTISLRLGIFFWTDDKSSFSAGAWRYDLCSLELQLLIYATKHRVDCKNIRGEDLESTKGLVTGTVLGIKRAICCGLARVGLLHD